MPKTFVVHGHSKWNPRDGYIQVPKGVSIEFYTSGGKGLYAGFAYQYLVGSSLALTGGAADQIVGPYRQCCEYVLTQLSQAQYDAAKRHLDLGTLANNPNYTVLIMKPGAKPRKLSLLLKAAEALGCSKVVWLACRAVDLNKVGGFNLGFNAGQSNRHVTQSVLDDHIIFAMLDKLEREFQ